MKLLLFEIVDALHVPGEDYGAFVCLSNATAYYRRRNEKYAECFDVNINLNSCSI